jgi:hypothetical protein
MALSDYTVERREIKIKECSFHVKGLSLDDFAQLIRHNLSDLEVVFDHFENATKGKMDLSESDLEQLVVSLAEQVPGLAASLIAAASGETTEAAVNAARSMPAPVQMKVLLDVVELTFDEVGGIKKAFEFVAGLMKKETPVIPQPTPESRR